ncbi:hypothetical protein WA026_001087 [Henosepilachna vigintioctopunctata]|uniref:Membrane metallo-endopeptidase-like 1 n=1 Tax=Henosepilachna vigintioctopunctata TaxID=420089 RepID=A0AAW1UZQ6_9CUCU
MATRLERILIVVLIAVIILVPLGCILVVSFLVEEESTICLNTECMRTAVQILDSIDHTVNPCDDFYMFVCGNYMRTNFIPEDKTGIDSFSKIEDSLSHKLRILLEEPIHKNEIKPFKFIKSHYKTCLNSSQDNTDLLKYTLRQLGGWPVLEGENWNSRNFDWRNLAHKLRKAGLHSEMFLVINAEVMLNNSTQRIIEIDEPEILYKEYLKNGLDDKVTKAMYNLMVDVSVLLGADRNKAQEEMGRVIKFLVDLTQISVPLENKRASSSLINIMTINDLELIFPIVRWMSYINNQLLGIHNVDKDTKVNVLYPKHLKKLNALIIHNNERTIANFMFWMVVVNEIQYLNQPLRDRLNDFVKVADGNTENTPKWKDCVDDVTQRLPLVAGALYVRNFFKKEAKESMQNLVDQILKQFEEHLQTVRWMEEKSKERAKIKASTVTSFIGYPDELLDDKILSDYYSELGDPPQSYLLMDMKLANFSIKSYYKFLNEPVNKTDWRKQHSPLDVNAFYETSTNSIHFPAGILQEIFFGHAKPKFVNFGGIGFLIGHEITHGFDDEGRLFDEKGNMVDWWSDSTRDAFMENALCIEEQYDNITVPEIGIKLNGANSKGENIADNGGIKQAYLAYKHWLSIHGRDMSLPGLSNYSNQQMFWISTASSWCSKMRPEKLKYMLMSDEHVPMYYRINLPFGNSKYFANDFNCPLGSNMNPVTKCEVW